MRLRLISTVAGLALSLAAVPALAQEPPATASAGPQTTTPPPADPLIPGVEPVIVDPPLQTPPAGEAEPEPDVEVPAAPPPPLVDPGPPNLNGGSSYGRFLAGRIAMNRGDSEASSDLFFSALTDGDGEKLARERAFSAAILAGDIDYASSIRLTEGESSPALVEAARLTRMVEAFDDRRDARRVSRETQADPVAAPHAWAGAQLQRFLAAQAGDWDTALAEAPATADAFTRIFSVLHRAQILEHRRRFDQADALYSQLMLDGAAAALFRQAYGEFLERRGRRIEAIALYDAGLAQHDDGAWRAARARAEAGGRPPAALSIKQGAAAALALAAEFATRAEAPEFSVAYLRMALSLDPENGEYWLVLGDALSGINMPTTAQEAWASTPRGSAAYLQARVQLALSLDTSGQTEEAIAVAREAASAAVGGQGDVQATYALAALLSQHGEYEATLAVLDGATLSAVTDNWMLLFLRGAANERLGRHEPAEAALEQALALSPDTPEILNYLGYLWIDWGVRVDEGIAMVERAVAAEPTSGSFQDSLGWGRYRQGRYDEAVAVLEIAVGLDAGSAVINDHLGDAYWQVGRQREARFQWSRVLTLDPDAALQTAVEEKLANGLTETPPPAE